MKAPTVRQVKGLKGIRRPLLERAACAVVGVAACVWLSACAQWPEPNPFDDARTGTPSCDRDISPADNTTLAGIADMIERGKIYAALAELEKLKVTAPKASLLRAKALRYTSRSAEAKTIYTGLLDTCYAGQAHHGLGLMAMKTGQMPDGLMHLAAASKALPTDPDIRNDHGYALMLADRFQDSKFELLTALDLATAHPRAARNLVMLSFRTGDIAQAQALGTQLGLDQTSMDKLQKQAAQLSTSDLAAEPASATSITPEQAHP